MELTAGGYITIRRAPTDGQKGDPGKEGNGIASVTEYYLISASSSGVTASTSGWSATAPTPTAAKPYLWNYEVIKYTNGTSTTVAPHIVGNYASDGRGISSVTNYYLATPKSSGVTVSTSGWTTTVQTISATDKYLWNYEVIKYTSGSDTTTTPHIIGVYGDEGVPGADGASAWTVRLADGTTTIALTTDDLTENDGHNFNVDGNTGRTLTLEAYYGQTLGKAKITSSAKDGCNITATTGASQLTLNNITGQAVTYDGEAVKDKDGAQVYMPVGAATITLTLTLTATVGSKTVTDTATLQIPIVITYTKQIGRLYYDNAQFLSQLSTITATQTETTAQLSAIEQTASSIKLYVDNTVAKGANLVRNSLLHCVWTQSGWASGEQARWLSVTAGKTYTLQAWGRILVSGATLTVGAYSDTDSAVIATVGISDTTLSTASVTFTAAKTERLRIFWNGNGKAVYCEKIQVVEGKTALPWSLAQDDPDAGDALYTDAAFTISGDTLAASDTNAYTDSDGTELTTYHYNNTAATNFKDVIFANSLFTPEPSALYTLSFWAKGSGTINCYLYPSACQGSLAHLTDTALAATDGRAEFTLSSQWQRIKVTFTTAATISGAKNLLAVRAMAGSEVWAAGIKFEKGGRATAYGIGEKMLATGIDIRNKKITVTADQFNIQNNAGQTTATVNKDGVLECEDIVCNGGTFNNITANGGTFTDVNVSGVITASEYLVNVALLQKVYNVIEVSGEDYGQGAVINDTTFMDGHTMNGVNVCVSEARTYHVFDIRHLTNTGRATALGYVRCLVPYPCKEREGKVFDICLDNNYTRAATAQYFRIECASASRVTELCPDDWQGRTDFVWNDYGSDEQTTDCFERDPDATGDATYIQHDGSTSPQTSRRLHVRIICADNMRTGKYQWAVMSYEFMEKSWMD